MAKPAHTQVLRAVTLRRMITNATKPATKVARTALTCSAWFDVAPVPVSRDMMVDPAMKAAGLAGRTASEQKVVALPCDVFEGCRWRLVPVPDLVRGCS